MASGLPGELAALLGGTDPRAQEDAWSAFVDRYSDLLLKAARSFGGSYDGAMDRYRYVLEALRADDFDRLRCYAARRTSGFESWLMVVARRLCLDFSRSRYGRVRSGESKETSEQRSVRRRLADLTGLELKGDLLPSSQDSSPERHVREAELATALDAALAELAPRDRLLLKLRFEDDLSVREVAEVLDFPSVFHVYRRLKAVLEELRRRLLARGVHDGAP